MISIHVPAWGTTCRLSAVSCRCSPISIHVPAWGTTRRSSRHQTRKHFNPRARMGHDSNSNILELHPYNSLPLSSVASSTRNNVLSIGNMQHIHQTKKQNKNCRHREPPGKTLGTTPSRKKKLKYQRIIHIQTRLRSHMLNMISSLLS